MTSAFHLDKWYLDTVTAEGVCVIGYRAEVRFRAVRLHYASVLEFVPGRMGRVRSSLRGGPAPVVEGGRVVWRCPALGVEMDVEGAVGGAAGAAGVSRRLYPGDGEHGLEARGTGAGFIDWACVAPGGRARVMIDGVVREGTGYAERIETTVPPHLLPMRGLRWGRFVADDASSASAWIQWRGREERDLVLHDGAVWRAGEVSEGRCGWRGAGDGAYEIRIEPGRTLRMSERAGSVLESIPMVRNFAPPIVRTALGLRQTRWLARGRLSGAGRGASAGWVVHEAVTFPEVA